MADDLGAGAGAAPGYLNLYGVKGTSTTSLWGSYLVNKTDEAVPGAVGTGKKYVNMDGFDLVWSQAALQTDMANVEEDIVNIENNANLSDTEKMFAMQMAINTWSAISLLRTNLLKSVSDTLKSIVRDMN